MRGLLAVCWLLAARTADAQNVQFPSMVEPGGVASPPMTTTPPPTWSAPASATPPPTWSAPGSTFNTVPPPTTSPPVINAPPAFDPYAAPLGQPAAGAPYSPYAPSPYSPAPYGQAPYTSTPSSLYPEGIQTPQFQSPTFGQPLKFMQEIRLRWTWLSPMGSESLGVNDVETNVSFAFPFFKTTSPLVITPGFAMHFWDGPVTQSPDFADLPARTYDAYLDAGWYPQFTPWLSAQLGARVGAYTDFNTFNNNSLRVMGRGLGVISLTPTLQIAAGVVYIDRLLIKMFPAGGVVWTPHADAKYEFLFPNPKLARRLSTLGTTDLWIYGMGEYGGGSWTIQRENLNDQFDYNDIRVAVGLESFGYRGMHGMFEVGYVFNRQILYRSGTPNFNPSDTLMLRAGIGF